MAPPTLVRGALPTLVRGALSRAQQRAREAADALTLAQQVVTASEAEVEVFASAWEGRASCASCRAAREPRAPRRALALATEDKRSLRRHAVQR